MIILPAILLDTVNEPFPADPFLWLWEIEVERAAAPGNRTLIRVVANDTSVVATGLGTFYPFPIFQGPIEQSGEGDLPTMTISVDNRTRWLMPFLDQSNGFVGNTAKAWLVNAFAPDIAQSVAFEFHVSSAEATAEAVTLRLDLPNFFQRQVPQDRYSPWRCRWPFGGLECGYIISATASFTDCPKTLDACIARGLDELSRGIPVLHPKRFGAFRGVPVAQ